jgi:hypothetical protein
MDSSHELDPGGSKPSHCGLYRIVHLLSAVEEEEMMEVAEEDVVEAGEEA